MKFRWKITWADGTIDNGVYAVSKELAEWGAKKWAHEGQLYGKPHGEPIKTELIPEE